MGSVPVETPTLPSAESIARYFLHLAAGADEATPVTQMQLHKLVYYAQGCWLATRERPLCRATFQAWIHGPVVLEMRPVFARFGDLPVPPSEARTDPSLTREMRGVLASIWLAYGRFSPWKLREMTHAEPPWKDARAGLPPDAPSQAPIPEESLRRYFRRRHEEQCRRIGMTAADLAQSIQDARNGRSIPLEEIKREFGYRSSHTSPSSDTHRNVSGRLSRSQRTRPASFP